MSALLGNKIILCRFQKVFSQEEHEEHFIRRGKRTLSMLTEDW